MEYTLSLILDEEAKVSLPLICGDIYKIDKYTTTFENATELREVYQDKIDEFLNANMDYLKSMRYKLDNFNFNGWIVILQKNGSKSIIKKALFKKNKKRFKELCSNKKIMRGLLSLDSIIREGERPIVSEFVSDLILDDNTFNVQSDLEVLKNELAKKKNKAYYEILRLMFKVEKMILSGTEISLLDKNNPNHIELINSYNEVRVLARNIMPSEYKTFSIDGVTYNWEEQEQFDLDDLSRMDTDLKIDGLDNHGKSFK